ncbi:MAG: hypothetical protein Q8920_05845 [Bacillota bacterium]|nr:hypothetical protein [Bacillota bacterium]
MVLFLQIISLLIILSALIAGMTTASFSGFLLYLAGGILCSAVFFALSRILEKQEAILYNLYKMQSSEKYTKEKSLDP